MAKTKVTLPTMDEDKRKFALRDWAKSNGAYCSDFRYTMNGKKQRSGVGWSRVAKSISYIQAVSETGGNSWPFAGFRSAVVRPRFQNPEQSGIATSEGNFLTFNGKIAYYPGTKITGEVQVIKSINLLFESDKIPPDVKDKHYIPYIPKQSESYEIVVDGKHGYATKLEGAKKYDEASIYNDGTKVENRAIVWHWLEPVSAEKQTDGSIQITEGILPVQFETQKKYEEQNIQNGTELDTDKFQVGKVLNTIFAELQRSAEVMAELTTHKAKKTTFAANLMKQAGKGREDK